MSWLQFHRTEAASALIEKHPAAFLLLSTIALRARFHDEPCPVNELKKGECYVGDWQKCGQASYKQFRISKQVLERAGFAAFKGTRKGTIASLLQVAEFSSIYTVSINRSGQEEGQHEGKIGAGKGPLTNKDKREEGKETLPFGSPEFASAWEDWKTFRKEKKQKLTPTTISGQFKKFTTWGESLSIAIIEQSISQGWTGLFPLKADKTQKPKELHSSDFRL